jgi:hypothetical protein
MSSDSEEGGPECELCAEPANSSMRFFDDDGTFKEASVCNDCVVGKCLHCSVPLPPFDEFHCSKCEALACPKCAFQVLGVKDRSHGERHCLVCIQSVVRARQRTLGAAAVAE